MPSNPRTITSGAVACSTVTQADVYIDVAGSVCGKGYGGGIMNGRTSWLYASQFSAEQSATMKAG